MEFILKGGNMNLLNDRKQIFLSLWWILEACVLYYYFMSFGLGIIILTSLLICISCLLLLKSYKVRAVLYLILSLYSIFFILGMYVLYLFTMNIGHQVEYYIPIIMIMSINVWISFRGFWISWKKSLPLP